MFLSYERTLCEDLTSILINMIHTAKFAAANHGSMDLTWNMSCWTSFSCSDRCHLPPEWWEPEPAVIWYRSVFRKGAATLRVQLLGRTSWAQPQSWYTHIWCSESTAFRQTWQNGAPISSFCPKRMGWICWRDTVPGGVRCCRCRVCRCCCGGCVVGVVGGIVAVVSCMVY